MDALLWWAGFLVVIPLWVICGRAGLAKPVALLAIIPLIGPPLVVLLLAMSRWENDQS
jgi:hypothetical protein